MWPNRQETADLVTFTEEFLMENFIFVQCGAIVGARGNMVYSFFVISGLAEASLAPCQTFFL